MIRRPAAALAATGRRAPRPTAGQLSSRAPSLPQAELIAVDVLEHGEQPPRHSASNDLVAYAGAGWNLAGVNGGDLFDPASHGLHVRPASTACWRGFVCRYELRDNALYLDCLDVALQGEAPPLLDKPPHGPSTSLGFTAAYTDVGLHIPFSGGLLLARDFLHELYVHMGFHPAWKYVHVLEVELEAGHISRVTDCSKAMADIRGRIAGTDQPGPGSSNEEIQAWIERAFSRKY